MDSTAARGFNIKGAGATARRRCSQRRGLTRRRRRVRQNKLLLKEHVHADQRRAQGDHEEHGGGAPQNDGSDTKQPTAFKVQRGLSADVSWQSFNEDTQLAAGDDGKSLKVWRTKYKEHDAVLGEAVTSGRHEWTVRAPNPSTSYAGVAGDDEIYPAARRRGPCTCTMASFALAWRQR